MKSGFPKDNLPPIFLFVKVYDIILRTIIKIIGVRENIFMQKIDYKGTKLQTAIVFIITFSIIMTCVYFLSNYQEKQERLKAEYTAESTLHRVEEQLNQYVVESNLVKKLVESGHKVTAKEFDALSRYMQDDKGVIEAHELAKDGVVSQVYPLKGNKEALSLDMLNNPKRKKEARLAKQSGQYTIAGPFELVQGGTGALLFNPIYMEEGGQEDSFWGFSILVINWEKFIEEVELDRLESAGYYYQIWKKDIYTGEKIIIDESSEKACEDMLEVTCEVPNDTWYFDIIPKNGWLSIPQLTFGFFVAAFLALLAAIGYWQFRMRRYKDAKHALELEKSMQKAQRANEAKTRFLFNMSHDIRTPMNAIIGFSDLLERHLNDKEKAADYIAKIKSSSSFLLSLINYVLEMSRIESGKATLKIEVGYFEELIDSLKAVFETDIEKKKLSYTCHTDIQHDYVFCDKTKVREVLLNIVSNSMKYTPEGGNISVDITENYIEKGRVTSYTFVIEDTGIGMSEEYLPHIFEEFTRERTSTESKVIGTGLGLPIVKSLVELMHGSIHVESEVGQGTRTTIILSFPIATKEDFMKGKEQKEANFLAGLKGRRILLAEDNDLNAEIAVTLLEENGFKVERTADGMQCISTLQEKPEGYYDVILMDIQMPNMDGYKATKLIRQLQNKKADIPIIAMTANAFDEDKQKALDAGMNAHIAKPIDTQILFQTLEQILRNH